jgi:hypothetical protein
LKTTGNNKAKPGRRAVTSVLKNRWVLGGAIIAAAAVLMLFYRPPSYTSPPSGSAAEDTYLTNVLAPAVYNGLQRGEPFDLLLEEDKINRAILSGDWPKTHESIQFSAPVVGFADGRITVMTTAVANPLEFVVTLALRPSVDDEGLLNIPLENAKVGALDVTPLVRLTGRKIYRRWTTDHEKTGPDDVRIRLVESLLDGRPFEGVFDLGGRRLRVKDVSVTDRKMTLGLVPEK